MLGVAAVVSIANKFYEAELPTLHTIGFEFIAVFLLEWLTAEIRKPSLPWCSAYNREKNK